MNLQMKSLVMALCMTLPALAQEKKEGYQFQTVVDLPATPVKDQFRSGTCWSFSGISFLESEMLRIGKKPVDLSEMFVVRHCYADKAQRYVRLHGSLNFGGGGAFHDVIYVMSKYGMVPESVYAGLNYGETGHVHGESDEVLKSYVDGVVKNSNKKLTTAWFEGFNGILDAYFGKLPASFDVDGKSFTPQSYVKEVMGLNADDYVQLSSYTHHPFYSTFAIEVPDNWLWGHVYNLPLDELIQVMDYSLNEGYTIGWATDVSEKGFSHKNGVAIVPVTDEKEMSGSERSKWESMSKEQKQSYGFDGSVQELNVTPEIRQQAYDNYLTTDDHGMHITGMVKDQNGSIYYKVKNSWNVDSKYEGYLYASVPFVRYKTMSIMVHKNAIPKEIRKKLGMK
ncbi:MAG: aminopeptidase C [Breznakibacter sp.]